VAAARSDYLADSEPAATASALDLAHVMAHLRRVLPADAVVTVDAGNFSGWPQRFLRFGGRRRLLGPTNGAMGYGVPAAIAAKLRHPERMVVACVGDGGFVMTGQELATAIQHGAAPIVLLFNNDMYGTIRMHQERSYPGRAIGSGSEQSGFRIAGRRLRRPRRAGGTHRGIRPGLRAGGALRPRRGHRTARRSRADQHADHAEPGARRRRVTTILE
jgi:acetolactate synthase-1/2/3 large subunit